MTTLLEAAQKVLDSVKKPSGFYNPVPCHLVPFTCISELKQAIADEKTKQQPARTCKTCKFYAVSCHLYEPCLRCTHQTGISDHWEPKP